MPSRGRLAYDMVGIGSLLARGEYNVPIYQRAYAWKTAEVDDSATAVDDFWDDLKEALDSGEPDYFLGSVVLTPAENTRRMTIIDGQQRLATTSLFLAALRDVWLERGDQAQAGDIGRYLSTYDRRAREDVPRLVLNEDDDPFYRQLVVQSAAPTPTKESHERIRNAYELLRTRVRDDVNANGARGDDRLLKWLDFLDDSVLVITVEVPTEAEAFVIFETLNDRGADLTIGDLLKNYLFMKAGSRLDTVKNSWIAALGALDVSAENEIFVTFLRHYWSSKYGSTRERELYAQIKKRVTNSTQAVSEAGDIASAAKDYAALLAPSHENWRRRGFTTTTSTNVDILRRLDLVQIRPLLLAVMKHFTVAQTRKTLQAAVNWSVRGIVVGGIGGGRTERAYAEAAVKVRSGTIKTAADLLAELSPIVPDDQTFAKEFASFRLTRTAVSRYLLLALERTARGDSEPEMVPNANEDEVNLEHILPRNGRPSDWTDFNAEEIGAWANRFGNHCLLKKSENAKIGNEPWAVKQPILKASSLKLTKAAAKNAGWTKAVIDKRQAALAANSVKTWPRRPR